jgi:hypothetical protein
MLVDETYGPNVMIVSLKEFRKNFLPYHASTVYKSQGGKIEGKFGILELNKQNKMTSMNMMYTAITRCTDYKNIFIDHNNIIDKFEPSTYENKPILMNEEHKEYHIHEITFSCSCEAKVKHCFKHSLKSNLNMTAHVIQSIDKKHKDICQCVSELVLTVDVSDSTAKKIASQFTRNDVEVKPILRTIKTRIEPLDTQKAKI